MAILPTLGAGSFDSCVCDPPYHLTSIVKRFGAVDAAPAQHGTAGAYARASRGFMGKVWDGGDVAFRTETWAAVLRVLKPGAHLIAFGGTRTYHRMVCAIEDAGFEVRDQIGWLYGSGFPKSHDVSKGIDKTAGAERKVVGKSARHVSGKPDQRTAGLSGSATFSETIGMGAFLTAPATESARQWSGWGTALKPAWEPIVLARKPLIGTVAANVLQHGTGAINIDGCRVETDGVRPWREPAVPLSGGASQVYGNFLLEGSRAVADTALGRWPANVIHDGSEEVLQAFPDSAGQQGDVTGNEPSVPLGGHVYGGGMSRHGHAAAARNDSGSAARFFYSSKADALDRLGSKHPTVKPVDLMRYLCRLVTPPGGHVLDCFAGSGTTGMAAMAEGFHATLIEREAEYVADIERRLAHVCGGDTPLFAVVA